MNEVSHYKLVSEPAIEQYCIYWNTSDFPKKFIVRRWTLDDVGNLEPDQNCKVFTRLTGARKSIPPGKIRIGRDVRDDASIVEVWI